MLAVLAINHSRSTRTFSDCRIIFFSGKGPRCTSGSIKIQAVTARRTPICGVVIIYILGNTLGVYIHVLIIPSVIFARRSLSLTLLLNQIWGHEAGFLPHHHHGTCPESLLRDRYNAVFPRRLASKFGIHTRQALSPAGYCSPETVTSILVLFEANHY